MEIGSGISRTPLLNAAYGNFYEFVKLLVENGANINAQDPDGWTCLHHAINHKNKSMVKTFVNEDANLELSSLWFGTPLHHALFDGEHEIFELLISFGANVNSLNFDGDSLLHCCVNDDEKLDSAKILLQNGALLSFKNLQLETPIETAMSNKKLSSMKLMMFC